MEFRMRLYLFITLVIVVGSTLLMIAIPIDDWIHIGSEEELCIGLWRMCGNRINETLGEYCYEIPQAAWMGKLLLIRMCVLCGALMSFICGLTDCCLLHGLPVCGMSRSCSQGLAAGTSLLIIACNVLFIVWAPDMPARFGLDLVEPKYGEGTEAQFGTGLIILFVVIGFFIGVTFAKGIWRYFYDNTSATEYALADEPGQRTVRQRVPDTPRLRRRVIQSEDTGDELSWASSASSLLSPREVNLPGRFPGSLMTDKWWGATEDLTKIPTDPGKERIHRIDSRRGTARTETLEEVGASSSRRRRKADLEEPNEGEETGSEWELGDQQETSEMIGRNGSGRLGAAREASREDWKISETSL